MFGVAERTEVVVTKRGRRGQPAFEGSLMTSLCKSLSAIAKVAITPRLLHALGVQLATSLTASGACELLVLVR
jgi:hypothetical protein